jgi:hypothetical protein
MASFLSDSNKNLPPQNLSEITKFVGFSKIKDFREKSG